MEPPGDALVATYASRVRRWSNHYGYGVSIGVVNLVTCPVDQIMPPFVNKSTGYDHLLHWTVFSFPLWNKESALLAWLPNQDKIFNNWVSGSLGRRRSPAGRSIPRVRFGWNCLPWVVWTPSSMEDSSFFRPKWPFLNRTSWRGVVILVYSSVTKQKRF